MKAKVITGRSRPILRSRKEMNPVAQIHRFEGENVIDPTATPRTVLRQVETALPRQLNGFFLPLRAGLRAVIEERAHCLEDTEEENLDEKATVAALTCGVLIALGAATSEGKYVEGFNLKTVESAQLRLAAAEVLHGPRYHRKLPRTIIAPFASQLAKFFPFTEQKLIQIITPAYLCKIVPVVVASTLLNSPELVKTADLKTQRTLDRLLDVITTPDDEKNLAEGEGLNPRTIRNIWDLYDRALHLDKRKQLAKKRAEDIRVAAIARAAFRELRHRQQRAEEEAKRTEEESKRTEEETKRAEAVRVRQEYLASPARQAEVRAEKERKKAGKRAEAQREKERRAWLATLISGEELVRRGGAVGEVKRLKPDHVEGGSHHNLAFCRYDPKRADVRALF